MSFIYSFILHSISQYFGEQLLCASPVLAVIDIGHRQIVMDYHDQNCSSTHKVPVQYE